MIKEFFGADLQAVLHKASGKLGIPIEQLSYRELPGLFGNATQGLKVGVLVNFDPDKVQPDQASRTDWLDELQQLADQPNQRAARILGRILEGLGMPAEVNPEERGEQVALAVRFAGEAPDTRRGDVRELRSAAQYLINRIQSQGNEGERRYLIDFGGDLEDRSAWIEQLSGELSAKVAELGQVIQVGLMDSQDRRLLHLALVEDPRVSTFSHGEGRFRVLCIKPKE